MWLGHGPCCPLLKTSAKSFVWPLPWWLQDTSVPSALSPGPLKSIASPSLLLPPRSSSLPNISWDLLSPNALLMASIPPCTPMIPKSHLETTLCSARFPGLRAPLIECCGAVSGCQIFALPCVGWESFAFLFGASGGQREAGDAACIPRTAGHLAGQLWV